MSFADEIRSQAKTKEQVAQESAREAEKREKQQREFFREQSIAAFGSIAGTIKSRIAEAAQSGNYRMEGGVKVIEDTCSILLTGYVLMALNWDDRNPSNYGLELSCQTLRERGRWFGIPKVLDRLQVRTRCPDVFRDTYRAFQEGLRQEGIEAAFVLKWSIPYKCKYDPWGTEYWRRSYQIPVEQLSEGYSVQDWFLRLHEEHETKELLCTYKFRF